MHFEWTISFGNIFSSLAMVFTVFAAYLAQRERLARMELKIDVVWRWWLKTHGGVGGNGNGV